MGRPSSLRDSLPGLGRLARRFWPYVRRERALITVSMVALYAEIGMRLLKWVLDRIAAVTRHRGPRLPILDALDPATLLAVSALAVIVFAGLRALAAYYNTVGFALIGNRVLTTVRNELYGQLQRLSSRFTPGRGAVTCSCASQGTSASCRMSRSRRCCRCLPTHSRWSAWRRSCSGSTLPSR